ncbi:Ran-binding protein 9 [Blyttiomyces sp. JEL0837]|nr:Ran-binding protein 9 [Blyttiomyces sp. JEL0837]
MDTSGPTIDAVIDQYEKEAPIDPDTIHMLIYEHLIYNCYSETAKAFGAACQLGGKKKPKFQISLARQPSKTGEPHQNSNNNNNNNSINNTGAMELDKSMNPSSSILSNIGSSAIGSVTAAAQMDIDCDLISGKEGPSILAGMAATSEDLQTSAASNLSLENSIAASLRTLEARKYLSSLIVSGKVREAIAFCNSAFPPALAASTDRSLDICFQLQCQQFIEYVRNGAAPEALRFAQEELSRYSQLNIKFVDPLQDIVALIAYTDPYNCPVAHYLSQDRRELVASNLNSYILSLDNYSPMTAIEGIIKQSSVLREVLAEASKDKKAANKAPPPRWDFASFVSTI